MENKNLIITKINRGPSNTRARSGGRLFFNVKAGSVSANFIVPTLIFVIGGAYLYTLNASAVKGYEVKDIEKEISELKKENRNLMIQEAELNSLHKIEKDSEELKMSAIEIREVAFIDEDGPVAFR